MTFLRCEKVRKKINDNWITAFVFLLFSVLKLLIISGNETITEGSDSLEYLVYADNWFWGSEMIPIRGPGFPLWIALVHLLNFSLRFFSELFFLISAGFFSFSLRKIRVSRVIIVIVFASIIFYPGSILVFDMPMSEGLFTIILLFNLSTAIFFLTAKNCKGKIIFGTFFGLTSAGLLHIRQADLALVYFFIFQVILTDIIFSSKKYFYSFRNALISYSAIIGTLFFVNISVFSLNFIYFGEFDYNKIASSAQERLFHVLMKIDTGEQSIHRYIPISTEARLTAYKLSSTFAEFKDEIEGGFRSEVNKSAYSTFSRTGIKDQFDLIDTFEFINLKLLPTIKKDTTVKEQLKAKNSLLNQISDEIEDSLNAEKAKSRYVVGMFNPSMEIFLNESLISFKKILFNLMVIPDTPIKDNYPFYGSLFSHLYDEMTNRNLELVKKGPMVLVFALPNNVGISKMEFYNDSIDFFHKQHFSDAKFSKYFAYLLKTHRTIYENMATAEVKIMDEKKVNMSIFDDIKNNAQFTFYQVTIPPVNDRVHLYFMKFVITLKNGKKVEIRKLEQGRLVSGDEVNSSKKLLNMPYYYYIKSFSLQLSPWQEFGYRTQIGIFNCYKVLVKCLTYFFICTISIFFIWNITFRVKNGRFFEVMTINTFIVAELLGVILSRMLYYAAVDAMIFPINLERHLFVSNILYIPILIIIIYKIFCLLKNKSFSSFSQI